MGLLGGKPSGTQLRRLAFATVLTLATAGLTQAASIESAVAATTHSVTATNGEGLWLHTQPGLSTSLVTLLADGTELSVNCFELSDEVTSPISDNDPVWLDVDTDQGSGWVSDAYVDTTWQTTQELTDQGIPECSQTTTDQNAEPDTSVPDTIIHYQGETLPNLGGPLPLTYTLYDHYMLG